MRSVVVAGVVALMALSGCAAQPGPAANPTDDESTVMVIGNPGPEDFQGQDFIFCQGMVAINATGIDWVKEYGLDEGALLGEVQRSGVTSDFQEWDATVLPVGTKIYQNARGAGLLVAVHDDIKTPYLFMIEG